VNFETFPLNKNNAYILFRQNDSNFLDGKGSCFERSGIIGLDERLLKAVYFFSDSFLQ